MCSDTQTGLRVRRSKADVVAGVGWRSDTGPGKPYWRRPEGLIGGNRSLTSGRAPGTGTGGDVVVGRSVVVVAGTFRSLWENRAAVAAAPVAADTPAMMARVVFDMVLICFDSDREKRPRKQQSADIYLSLHRDHGKQSTRHLNVS